MKREGAFPLTRGDKRAHKTCSNRALLYESSVRCVLINYYRNLKARRLTTSGRLEWRTMARMYGTWRWKAKWSEAMRNYD